MEQNAAGQIVWRHYWQLNKRLMALIQQVAPGLLHGGVIDELKELGAEYKRLLEGNLPFFITQEQVIEKIADATYQAAFASTLLGDVHSAQTYYAEAADWYERIGRQSMADYCRDSIKTEQFRYEADVNEELERLQQALGSAPPDTLEHVELAVEVAKLYLSNGDDYAASPLLEEAEIALKRLGYEPPTGEEVSAAFQRGMNRIAADPVAAIQGPYEHIILLRVQSLFWGLYSALAQLHRDDATKSQGYIEKAKRVTIASADPAGVEELSHMSRNRQMLIRLEEATQDALLEMTLREMHEALGEEQFRQFFGNLPEEVAETRRTYNEIRQQIWGETAQGIDSLKNPDAKGIIDPAELRTELESLGLENARRPNNEARDDLLERAVALEGRARAAGIPEFLILALLRRAAVLVAAGKDNEAIAPLEEARAKAALVAQSTYGVQALSMLADVASRREDWHDVMDIAQEGISLVEKYRYKVAAPYLQSAYMRARIKLYLLGIRAAYERAEIQLMIKWAELAKSRNALFYPQVETARSESIDQLREEFRKINEQIAAGRAQGTVQEELLHKRRTIWDLLFTARLQSTSRMSVPEFTLAALQDRLDEDEGILNYFWLDRLTLLIIGLDKRRIVPEVRRLTPDDRLLLEKLSRNITLQNQGSEEHPRTLNYGLLEKQVRAASSLLLPSCSEDLFKGKRKLIVSPHQLLHTVPFHAFQWHEGYLIESLAVSYVPNLSSLLLSYAPTENSQVLLVGVSDYNVPGLQLRPLAKATEEIETVRGIYESRGTAVKILKDQEATLDRLKSLVTEEVPGDFSCLHFSVHGESVSSNTPMESRLFLRDAQLDGLDIADWELRAPLVVLSACYSGQRSISGRGMEELPGDDLFGLQAAFFAGGVRQVIGGLWPVDSYAALPIMAHFHGSFASGVSPEVALQEAMKTYLKTADALTRMVYYWGPFFLVAMGRVDK